MCQTSKNEVILFGSPENDHVDGNFVWNCIHCQCDFYGEQYDYICYKCANQNDPKKSDGMEVKDLIIAVLVAAILFGVIFL